MLTIGVIGANGTAGTRVVARLKGRDVGGVEIARAYGVDLVSGQGLAEAPQGVDVVVDVSNPTPADERSDLAEIVTTASR
ncbi:MAG TPA: NmrA family protein, partial [Mycobacterium sp.]|nr:NmrA family protein [Mycobacterium sp.]